MAIIVRHNGAAANALEGLERGLTSGFGFGLAINRQRREEKESEQFRQQALKRAQQIDRRLQMEEQDFSQQQGARQAGQQAMGGLFEQAFPRQAQPWPSAATAAQPSPKERRAAMRQAGIERLRQIIPHMNPRESAAVIQSARDLDMEAEQQAERDEARQRIEEKLQMGGYRLDLDETRTEEENVAAQEQIDERVQQLAELMDNPQVEPSMLTMLDSQITQSMVRQGARGRLRRTALERLEADFVASQGGGEQMAGAPGQPTKPGQPAQAGAMQQQQPAFNVRQVARLSELLEAFKRDPRVMDDPRMAQSFWREWENAKMGIAGEANVGGVKIPVTFEQADQMLQQHTLGQEAERKETEARANYYNERGGDQGMTDYQSQRLGLDRDKLDFDRQKARAEGLDLDGEEDAQAQPGVQPQTPQEQALVDFFRRTGKDPRNPQHREEAKQYVASGGTQPVATPPAAAPAAAPVAPAAAPQAAAPVAPAPAGGGALSSVVDALGGGMPTDRASAHTLREALRVSRNAPHAPPEWKQMAEAAVSELDALIEKNGWTATAAVRREAIRAAGELVKSFQSFIGGGDG